MPNYAYATLQQKINKDDVSVTNKYLRHARRRSRNCVILYEVYTQSFSPAKENIGGHFESGSLAGTVKQNGVDYRADS